MRADLFTHPKVVRMASALKADGRPDVIRVVGGLMSVWCLFDAHSADGVLEGYTPELIDDHLRWVGFAGAMNAVGWIEQTECGSSMKLPDFDKHNGQSAKRRAQDSDRKREDRKKSASEADEKRTREEKRREEEIQEEPNGSSRLAAPSDIPACPQDEIIGLYHEHLPELAQVKLKTESRSKAMRGFWRWVLTSKKSDGQKRANDSDQALSWIRDYFGRVRGNAFLMGQQSSGRHANWRADFDFLLTERGRKHVIEKTEVSA
ncbi:hypothetical protein [Roseateles sp. PN1]|uniref:hypothetical protein n=1 Tax=Roseateles sp. PN1 TaxID=3137372 RepID=UPI003138A5C1